MRSHAMFAAAIAVVVAFADVTQSLGGEPPSDLVVSRIALGSCAKQDRPMPIWSAVSTVKPDVLLMLGDNIYGDTEDMTVLRQKYDLLAADRGFGMIQNTVPIVAVWDDHDYGANDAGLEYPKRRESQQVFLDFFEIPEDSVVRKRQGIYRAMIVGPIGRRVQFICLDTRFHRSPLKAVPKAGRAKGLGPYGPTDDPNATVLGSQQWDWLTGMLQKPAEIRIILSSIQVASSEHGWEHWGQFPLERAKLLKTIRDAEAAGVIIVSGDRHSAEISRIPAGDDALPYPLFDLTASSLNQPLAGNRDVKTDEPNRHRLGERFHGANFGTIDIEWGTADDGGLPSVTLAIHDVDGKVVRSETIPPGGLEAPK